MAWSKSVRLAGSRVAILDVACEAVFVAIVEGRLDGGETVEAVLEMSEVSFNGGRVLR